MSESGQVILENIAVAAVYWGISYLNWLIFRGVGVLPMPVWPAAAIAIITALYRGWAIAPGIAVGTILANHFLLGASWPFSCCISIMNTLGPILGAMLIKRKSGGRVFFGTPGNIAFGIVVGIVFVPLLSAFGGVGSKYMFGLVTDDKVFTSIIRWAMAHGLGTFFFGIPVLAWLQSRGRHEL
jgi:integral membrane sensor domain MASE1